MPLYVDISPLHRLVVIVGRGLMSAEEIRIAVEQLAAQNVRSYAKIIEVAGATTAGVAPEQLAEVAALFRNGDPTVQRGPVAFITDKKAPAFSGGYERLTRGELPVRICRSLREARTWIDDLRRAEEIERAERPLGADRHGILVRGSRYRKVTVDSVDRYVRASAD